MPVLTGIPYDKTAHYCNYGSFNVNPRGTHVLDRRDLYFKDGSSDKVYIVIISQSAQGQPDYYVDAFYGRRGSSTTHQPKSQVKDVYTAQTVASKLITEKKNKGYVDFIQGAPPTAKGQVIQQPNLKASSVFPPTDLSFPGYYLPGAAGGTRITANAIMDDTLYILEERLDGPRVYFNIPDSAHSPVTIIAYDSNTGTTMDITVTLPHLMQFARSFTTNRNIVLEGVLQHPDLTRNNEVNIWQIIRTASVAEREELYLKVVDMPFFGGNYLTQLEWKDRRKTMTQLFTEWAKILNTPKWNMFDEYQVHPVVMHRYAFTNKDNFTIGKNEIVGKHLRSKYYDSSPGKTVDEKDKWITWRVGTTNGRKRGS